MDDFWMTVHRVPAGASAYITDPADRALLVKPNYRDGWSFPGGLIDEHEHPEQACAREIAEELGLSMLVGRLLVVHWVRAERRPPYALVAFQFDGGTIPADTPITLQAEELDDYGFFSREEAKELLPAHAYERLLASAAAREAGGIVYLSPAEGGGLAQQSRG